MTTIVKVETVSVPDDGTKVPVVKVVCSGQGCISTTVLEDGESAEFTLYDGQGIVVEEMDTSQPDGDAKVLTDEVPVADGAA